MTATPLAWHGVNRAWGPDALPSSYLPALEAARPRRAFIPGPIEDLTGMQPGIITIGDSMAGRIEPDRLTALAETPVAPLLQNATGTAYWYLAFKNWVVASDAKPRWVVIFFRDTNLTDPMFRLGGPYRNGLDEVAGDSEPELNRIVALHTSGPWFRVHQAVDRASGAGRARDWLPSALSAWSARVVVGSVGRARLQEQVNAAFGLDRLRPIAQADIASADDAATDFAANVDRSLLPAFLDLARAHHLNLCFVRVMRRPDEWGQAPRQSRALRLYMAALRTYIEARGGALLDDNDDADLARIPYGDGDHIERDARVAYTDRFWPRLSRLGR